MDIDEHGKKQEAEAGGEAEESGIEVDWLALWATRGSQ
jgi:hypothetical protein